MNRYGITFLAHLCAAIIFLPATGYAQNNGEVRMRLSQQDDYERIVFEWPGNPPSVQIERQDNNLTLSFGRDGDFNTEDILETDSALVETFEITEPGQIRIQLNEVTRYRELTIGNRVILDLFGDLSERDAITQSSSEMQQSEPEDSAEAEVAGEAREPENTEALIPRPVPKPEQDTSQPEEPQEEREEEQDGQSEIIADAEAETGLETPLQEADTTITISDSANETNAISKNAGDLPAPSNTVLEQAYEEAEDRQPHILSLSLADAVHAAAFERFGYLWLVVDSQDVPISPSINGPDKDKFGQPEEIDITSGEGSAWRVRLPPGYHAYGEGGNMVWRLILTSNPATDRREPVIPQPVDNEDSGEQELYFPIPYEKEPLDLTDPDTGETISVITTENAAPYIKQAREYVMMDVLKSPIGMAYIEKNDDVMMEMDGAGVVISAPEGLSLSKPGNLPAPATSPQQSSGNNQDDASIFDFPAWQMGARHFLYENEHILLSSLGSKTETAAAERLMRLAKLNLAHGYGAEAQGYLALAASETPQLQNSPIYQALYGVAGEVTGQNLKALEHLSVSELESYEEIDMWKASALAGLGDWRQAAELLPEDFNALNEYPPVLAYPLTLKLAEAALRNGDFETGKGLLARLQGDVHLTDALASELKYLQGEVYRQSGQPEKAVELWTELTNEPDPLFRAKAELALVTLGEATGEIPLQEAIERLDQLRFVWRGDDLEVQILQKLGKLQIENGDYLRGLSTLRDTVELSDNDYINNEITNTMVSTYKNVFLTDELDNVPATEAAMLYEEFRELTPTGREGDEIVGRLAGHLASADLFDRSIDLLEYQLEYRLSGQDAVTTATKLASVYLMDRQPEQALQKLNKAETELKNADLDNKAGLQRDIDLLRARALADNDDVNAALQLLDRLTPSTPEVNRLQADIAWEHGRWYDAAGAMRELVLNENIAAGQELSEKQAQMLMNYAITLNLSDGRTALANLRAKYLDRMMETEKGNMFEVVSRPRQDGLLADRTTIRDIISETEIFGDFLENYQAN